MDKDQLAFTRRELERMLQFIIDLQFLAEKEGNDILAGGRHVAEVREAITPTRRALNDLRLSVYRPQEELPD